MEDELRFQSRPTWSIGLESADAGLPSVLGGGDTQPCGPAAGLTLP